MGFNKNTWENSYEDAKGLKQLTREDKLRKASRKKLKKDDDKKKEG